MRVSVSLHDDRLRVEVRTETAEATQLINERVAALKAALAAHGVTVDRFDVSYDGPNVGRFGAQGDGSTAAHYESRGGARDDGGAALDDGADDPIPDLWGIAVPATLSSRQRLDVSV
jgi:flagellar hook-length control protein FliK